MNYEKMSKEELLKLIKSGHFSKKRGRKEEVLELLKKGYDTIEAIAEELGITSKNVSSVLTALRKDGHFIMSYKIKGQAVVHLVEDEEEIKKFLK